MKLTVKEMVLVSMFAALACLGALLLRVGGTGIVPYSILPFVVLLAGAMLGSRLGALSLTVYVALGLVGVPVFASAPYGGIAYLVSPTAGFLFGYIGAAYATGRIVEILGKNTVRTYLLASCAGLVVLYLIGLPYLYVVLNYFVGKAVNVMGILKIGLLPFIGFDLVKALIVSLVTVPVMKQAKTGRFSL
ncbi:MAG: biotin transporter BioY [Eubacteriales bacterium]